jgi:hypothetical protein
MAIENVTGWNELMDGKVIKSVYTMFDASLLGWFVPILFFTFQIMLYSKTKNLTLCWVTGILFGSLYGVSIFMNSASNYILFLILVLELAGILFMTLVGRK